VADLPEIARERVAREDLILFINACYSGTGQREFYSDADAQRVSLSFLHRYILGNYRQLYARTLAAGVNDFSRGEIVLNLLATGNDTSASFRAEENALVTAAVRSLPPQRTWALTDQIRRRGINNRRSRALVRDLVQNPGRDRDISFDAVKYRAKVRAGSAHAHLRLSGEIGRFLFGDASSGPPFATPLFEGFRRAHFSAEAVYDLPYTVAEGFAARHGIPRDTFLTRIASRMTPGERLRLQDSATRAGAGVPEVDLALMSLTKLALFTLSRPRESVERGALDIALRLTADRTLRRLGGPNAFGATATGHVAAVLDNSYSSSGSSERRLRALGVALAAHYLLRAAAAAGDGSYRPFWIHPLPEDDRAQVIAAGQTDLATPLLDALEWGAETILIVSDGYENDPPNGASEVLRLLRLRIDPQRRIRILHANPVLHPDDFAPRALSPLIPTVGLRDAEDLPTVLAFARLADGGATMADLDAYLAERRDRFLIANGVVFG
jgi:hypothetical protein